MIPSMILSPLDHSLQAAAPAQCHGVWGHHLQEELPTLSLPHPPCLFPGKQPCPQPKHPTKLSLFLHRQQSHPLPMLKGPLFNSLKMNVFQLKKWTQTSSVLCRRNCRSIPIPRGLGDPGFLFSLVLDATCHNTVSFPRIDTLNPKAN